MAEDNKLGRKITTLREAHHLTCQDLADRCGCDVTVIEKLEAGEVPPSLAPLIKLTDVYKRQRPPRSTGGSP